MKILSIKYFVTVDKFIVKLINVCFLNTVAINDNKNLVLIKRCLLIYKYVLVFQESRTGIKITGREKTYFIEQTKTLKC